MDSTHKSDDNDDGELLDGHQEPIKDRLSISDSKVAIIEAVKDNQFVIIRGETGCGKTTQVPQYLLAKGLNNDRMIGITQPRRIAAVNMAKRVAQEMGETLGKTVGYEIRFDRKCGASTKIKYMTDGIFLNECIIDKSLKEYQIIMLDEAHERSVMTDVLLGLLKLIAVKRPDLKVIISSATITTDKFVKYFDNAKVINVITRLYPVSFAYHQYDTDYIDKAVEMVKLIIESKSIEKGDGKQSEKQSENNVEKKSIEKGDGKQSDILIFLTGQEEIYRCCDLLKSIENAVPKPLCSNIDFESQQDVFNKVPEGKTKVVVATNIAETSITIEGVKYVIDCGYVKQNRFNPQRLMEVLEEVWISKAQADQRKGRAGRTQPGICHRLYTEERYNLFDEECTPEIFRKNLSEVYLRLRALELNPESFGFLEPPIPEELQRARKELIDLSLLTPEGNLTDDGHKIAHLPLDPVLGKVLLVSLKNQCTMDVIRIVCMFSESMQKIFKRPRDKAKEFDNKHKKFHDKDGDHFSLLNVYSQWRRLNVYKERRRWCQEHFIDHNIMEAVEKAIKQIVTILKRHEIKIRDENENVNKDGIKKCFVAGYFKNICVKQPRDVYIRSFDQEVFHLHYSSNLREDRPKIILFNDPIKSTKSFASGVMSLDEDFLRTNFPEELTTINFPEDINKPPSF